MPPGAKTPVSKWELMRLFVTGTDTDVGKTVVSAWAMLHLDVKVGGARYWKPVQSGLLDDPGDRATVESLTGLAAARFHPCAYELPEPLSPHEAAKRAGVEIDMSALKMPEGDGPLIVEGAGGLLVPLNRDALMIDLIKALRLPVILVSRSTLGTINHTLLSLEALRHRDIEVAGVVFNGPPAPHNRQAVEEYGRVHIIAEIPQFPELTRDALLSVPADWPAFNCPA